MLQIKVLLLNETAERLFEEAQNEGRPTDQVAGELIQEALQARDAHIAAQAAMAQAELDQHYYQQTG